MQEVIPLYPEKNALMFNILPLILDTVKNLFSALRIIKLDLRASMEKAPRGAIFCVWIKPLWI